MVDRVILISHLDFHKRNFDHIIKILLDNDSPLKFIFDIIRLRIKTLIKRKIIIIIKNHLKMLRIKLHGLQFLIQVHFRKNLKIISDSIVKLSYFSFNKLCTIIKTHKDPIPVYMRKNVIYRISCNECDASCVGQTSRQLKKDIRT